jgi:hypothetical protein
VKRPFEAWSIVVPSTFAETFVEEGSYWHVYDAHRSVSLTSVLLTGDHGPVPRQAILAQLGGAAPRDQTPVDELPPGLEGWAVEGEVPQPARASRAVSGMVATDGRVLIATITSEDLGWARGIWISIQAHPAPPRGDNHVGQAPAWRRPMLARHMRSAKTNGTAGAQSRRRANEADR